ncbi:MAG: glycosyltransferase family 4 protein [Herpetosiphon sp.]|nr:glycosyltransferase family 4 protein [Herpetosiphon sp.]
MTIKIYPIPRQLATSPYLDQLYQPFAAWHEFELQRVPFKQAIRQLLTQSGSRIAHWHFFDELTQQPSQVQTGLRTISFISLLRIMRWRGVKLIWTAHNIEPHELRHPAWAERAYRAMFNHAHTVIAHSQAAADLLRQRYAPTTPIKVIPHGAYVGLHGARRPKNASRNQLNLPHDQFIALNLGTLRPYKGLELLLDAWQNIDGRLLIAGGIKDYAYAEALRNQARMLNNVDLRLDFVPDADLPLWFGAADVVVLPYRKLLTSGILLWALSYGVPVVAPNLPPVRELIQEGHNGFLFDPNDHASLHAAIQRAAQHPDLAQLGENAYQTALPFDWQRIAERTAEVYRGVQRALDIG